MPRVSIRTLPLEDDIHVPGVLKLLGKALETKFGYSPRQFVMLWDFIRPGHFLFAGQLADDQPPKTHHPFIEITAVEGMPRQKEKELVRFLAYALAEQLRISPSNVCVVVNILKTGKLFVFNDFK